MKGIITSHPLKGAFPSRTVTDLMTEENESLLTESEQAITAVEGSASMRAGLHAARINAVLTSNPITGALTGDEHITGRLEYGR